MISKKAPYCLTGQISAHIDKRELRKYISIVLQDVFLFSGTIKSNINMNNEDIPFERVLNAAKLVGADKFINLLPDKYDEEVKERGSTLKRWAETAYILCKGSGVRSEDPCS